MCKWLASLVFLALPAIAGAQVTVPHTFNEHTTARASQVNENLNALGAQALNRTGGHVTGDITVDGGVLIDGVDISSMLTPTSATLPTLTVSGTTTLTSLTVTGAGAFSGTVNVGGTLTAALFTGSGSGLTNIPETAIADGTILTRRTSTESITASWNFASTLSSTSLFIASGTGATGAINVRSPPGSPGYILWTEDAVADRWALGIDPASGNLRLRIASTSGTIATMWSTAGVLLQQQPAQFASTVAVTGGITSGSHFDFTASGVYDLASETRRARDIYFGRYLVMGDGASANSTPTSATCNSTAHRGRMIYVEDDDRLYVCQGTGAGWMYVQLLDAPGI